MWRRRREVVLEGRGLIFESGWGLGDGVMV